MLSVMMPNVVVLSVVAPTKDGASEKMLRLKLSLNSVDKKKKHFLMSKFVFRIL
jgi:hypothetical protein